MNSGVCTLTIKDAQKVPFKTGDSEAPSSLPLLKQWDSFREQGKLDIQSC